MAFKTWSCLTHGTGYGPEGGVPGLIISAAVSLTQPTNTQVLDHGVRWVFSKKENFAVSEEAQEYLSAVALLVSPMINTWLPEELLPAQ